MPEVKWSISDVLSIIEKSFGLIVAAIEHFETPERAIKHIKDRTNELRQGQREIEDDLRDKYRVD